MDITIRHAFVVLRDYGFTNIILVSDCLWTTQCICSPERGHSEVGVVVSDIENCDIFHHLIFQTLCSSTEYRELKSCNFYFYVIREVIRDVLSSAIA
jgi:hypothetical protein